MPLSETEVKLEIEAALKEIESGDRLSHEDMEHMVKQWQKER